LDDFANDLAAACKYVNDQNYIISSSLKTKKKYISPLIALYLYNVKFTLTEFPKPSICNLYGLFNDSDELQFIYAFVNNVKPTYNNSPIEIKKMMMNFIANKYNIDCDFGNDYDKMMLFDVDLYIFLRFPETTTIEMKKNEKNHEIHEICEKVINKMKNICDLNEIKMERLP
jgi:hypothetical protein